MTIYSPYVYSIIFINPETQLKEYYIGARYANSKYNGIAHPSDLFKSYFTSSNIMLDYIKKYGIEHFHCKVRKVFKTKKETMVYEKKLLTKLNAKNRQDFINRSNGGLSYYSHVLSEETKRKMSVAKKGKKFTEEHKNKLKLNHKGNSGRKATEEAKRNMSAAQCGENNGFYGRNHDEEARKKISENNAKWNAIHIKDEYGNEFTSLHTCAKFHKKAPKAILNLCNDDNTLWTIINNPRKSKTDLPTL